MPSGAHLGGHVITPLSYSPHMLGYILPALMQITRQRSRICLKSIHNGSPSIEPDSLNVLMLPYIMAKFR